jgi:hypothetical protein
MSPPTEQLIRDYLNRLSVAARGRLSSEDRRALVTRTHDFIERNASRSGPATAMEVAALLSRLGDPGALVDQEVARLAAERGEAVATETDQATGLAARLRRRTAHASWHWPATAAHPELVTELLNGHGGNGAKPPPAQPPDPAAVVPRQSGPADRDAVGSGPPPQPDNRPDAARPVRPAAAGSGDADAGDATAGANDVSPAGPEPSDDGAAAARPGPAAGPAEPAAGEPVSEQPVSKQPVREQPVSEQPVTRQAATVAELPARPARIRSLASGAMALSRRHPLEAAAIVLLGLGGVVFPPVWIVGAAVAAASKVWDYRDKWAGIAGPVVLLIVGTSLGVALGSSHHELGGYLHEVWIYLDVLSRLCAVAGAWYLYWRLTHARPVPDVPPWNRPGRVD